MPADAVIRSARVFPSINKGVKGEQAEIKVFIERSKRKFEKSKETIYLE